MSSSVCVGTDNEEINWLADSQTAKCLSRGRSYCNDDRFGNAPPSCAKFPRPGLQVLESQLGKFLVEYSGDTLWALMMYLLVSSTLPSSHVGRRFTVTLMIAFLIEFSQLYHAPWIDAIRQTTVGGLVLAASDFPLSNSRAVYCAYELGVEVVHLALDFVATRLNSSLCSR